MKRMHCGFSELRLESIYESYVLNTLKEHVMSERIRSFIAFDMQNEQVLSRLAAAQKLLTETGADLKFVEPQNIHVTMRFLGDISPRNG